MNPLAQRRSVIATVIGLMAIAMPSVHAQQTPTAKDLSAVIDMLRSPDPVVRTGVACSRNVFNTSAVAAIPALVEMLDDDEPVAPEVCREDRRPWWGDESVVRSHRGKRQHVRSCTSAMHRSSLF